MSGTAGKVLLNSQEFLAEHGLENLADQRISAHGSEFTVAEAVVECPPFAKMVINLAASLEGVDMTEEARKEVLAKSIMANAPEDTNPEVESKKK